MQSTSLTSTQNPPKPPKPDKPLKGTPKQKAFVLATIACGGDYVQACKNLGYGGRNPWTSAKQLLEQPYVQALFKSNLGKSHEFDRRWVLENFLGIFSSCSSDSPADKAIALKANESVARLLGVDQPEQSGARTLEDLVSQAAERNRRLLQEVPPGPTDQPPPTMGRDQNPLTNKNNINDTKPVQPESAVESTEVPEKNNISEPRELDQYEKQLGHNIPLKDVDKLYNKMGSTIPMPGGTVVNSIEEAKDFIAREEAKKKEKDGTISTTKIKTNIPLKEGQPVFIDTPDKPKSMDDLKKEGT